MPKTAKAVVMVAPGKVEVQELPYPDHLEPGAGLVQPAVPRSVRDPRPGAGTLAESGAHAVRLRGDVRRRVGGFAKTDSTAKESCPRR